MRPLSARPLYHAALALFVAVLPSPSVGQVARSGAAPNAAAQQLQQLAQERTALQAENARLKKDLDKAAADLAAAQAERDALRKKAQAATLASQAHAACAANEEALQQKQARLDELVARFRETAQTLREVETGRARAQQQLAEKSRAFDACAQANVGLYDLASEALTRYERDATAHAATFTRITRNRIENLVDDYRARAQELKLPEAPQPAPP